MDRPIALTMGEPAGIGGEITLKAWLRRKATGSRPALPPFFVIDDPDRLERLGRRLNVPVPVSVISTPHDAGACFDTALPVLPQALSVPVEPGKPTPENTAAVQASITRAVALVQSGDACALVTNPIHKQVMYRGGFLFPGHTEFLASLTGGREIMMLACPGLRVVPVTCHVSLSEAIRQLTTRSIVEKGKATAAALITDFRISHPRLAVAALNPHAGEDGAMGHEEEAIIAPAVAELMAAGIATAGPLPADTLFHTAARQAYDVVLCMYHDQALIPLKTIDFAGGVNITLGLPIVRTSPDHGTAFHLAGTGTASETSLVAAIFVAAEIAANRRLAAHG